MAMTGAGNCVEPSAVACWRFEVDRSFAFETRNTRPARLRHRDTRAIVKRLAPTVKRKIVIDAVDRFRTGAVDFPGRSIDAVTSTT
jgi:hypothetical protein